MWYTLRGGGEIQDLWQFVTGGGGSKILKNIAWHYLWTAPYAAYICAIDLIARVRQECMNLKLQAPGLEHVRWTQYYKLSTCILWSFNTFQVAALSRVPTYVYGRKFIGVIRFILCRPAKRRGLRGVYNWYPNVDMDGGPGWSKFPRRLHTGGMVVWCTCKCCVIYIMRPVVHLQAPLRGGNGGQMTQAPNLEKLLKGPHLLNSIYLINFSKYYKFTVSGPQAPHIALGRPVQCPL